MSSPGDGSRSDWAKGLIVVMGNDAEDVWSQICDRGQNSDDPLGASAGLPSDSGSPPE